MALIKCPECQRDVSDKAEICVHCGFPIQEWIEAERNKKANPQKKRTKEPETLVDVDPMDNEFTDFMCDFAYWKKPKNTDTFFNDLYKCAFLNSKAYKYFTKPHLKYAMYLFAVWDICLCKRFGYDKHAGKDWIRNNSKRIADDYNHWDMKAEEIVDWYNEHRYQYIKTYEIDEREDYENDVDMVVTKSTRLNDYGEDMFRQFFGAVVKTANGEWNADEETRMHSEMLLSGIMMMLNNVYDVFCKIDLQNDYQRASRPVLDNYDLPENIDVLYKTAEKEASNHFTMKTILAKLIPGAIVAYIVYLSIAKEDWVWLCLAWFPVIWLIGAGHYTDYEKWKYIDDKGGIYKTYHKYQKDCEEYDKWYAE